MPAPLVSVIIPCYNDEPEHLAAAIQSVRDQDYEPIEIVVIDDGSTAHRTVRAVDELAPDIEVVRQENLGVAAARNAGVARANGPYVQLLDADDMLGANQIAEAVRVLEDDKDAVIAFPGIAAFGDDDYTVMPNQEVGLSDLLDGNKISIASLIRRSRWEQCGGQLESLRDGFEDYEFWVRALAVGGKAVPLPTALMRYRVRPGSLSKRLGEDALNRTREAILATNANQLDTFMRAAFSRMDAITRTSLVRRDQLSKWDRRTRIPRWVRDRGRSVANMAKRRITPR